jgi:hypothetical protein
VFVFSVIEMVNAFEQRKLAGKWPAGRISRMYGPEAVLLD